jgi:hypothetical protein
VRTIIGGGSKIVSVRDGLVSKIEGEGSEAFAALVGMPFDRLLSGSAAPGLKRQ